MGMASKQTRGVHRVSVFIFIVVFNVFLFFSAGKVLIFVTRKDNCAELAKNLKENGYTGKY